VSGVHAGDKFGFEQTTTDAATVFTDHATDAVVITTRHDSHANYVLQALGANKHVFVEKPLCLSLTELHQIKEAMSQGDQCLMVGFNRRFSPHVQQMKKLLTQSAGPKSFIYTANAGAIPADHWTQDPQQGGGRILGEACHFIDLLRYLAGVPIRNATISYMDSKTPDTATISLIFEDGSIGAIHYFANGSKSFPKERVEVFTAGKVLQLDNFRKLSGFGWSGFKPKKLWRQDKGQGACAAAFVSAIASGKSAPISFEEIYEVSKLSIELAQ